jgi:hypothetical protein
MASHVDIVSNEPLSSESRLIARVVLNGGPALEMDLVSNRTDQQKMWSYLCSRVPVDPKHDPGAFLKALALNINATYVHASDVHDDEHCPFRRSTVDISRLPG